MRAQLIDLTRRASEALNVHDVSRVDFRLGADDQPYLLEINTLPGLNPQLSDLCIMAATEGISHQVLITEILHLAAERHQFSASTGEFVPSKYERHKTAVGRDKGSNKNY